MMADINVGHQCWFDIQCLFLDKTGYAQPIIMKGYYMLGLYCVENCSYAWLATRDDA